MRDDPCPCLSNSMSISQVIRPQDERAYVPLFDAPDPPVDEEALITERTREMAETRKLAMFLVPTSSGDFDGQAWCDLGNTRVVCQVTGPRPVSKPGLECRLNISLTLGPWIRMTTAEISNFQNELEDILARIVICHHYPKSQLDIHFVLLENDGGTLTAAINAACLALNQAGISMEDLFCHVQLAVLENSQALLLDPDTRELDYITQKDNKCCLVNLTLAMESQKIIYLNAKGRLDELAMNHSFSLCKDFVTQVGREMKSLLKKDVLERSSTSHE